MTSSAFFQSRDPFGHIMTLRFLREMPDLSIPFSVVSLPRCSFIKKAIPRNRFLTPPQLSRRLPASPRQRRLDALRVIHGPL